MLVDHMIALAAFAFVTSITPGPNNLMLMASGANFGFHRTIPHMLGVGLGFVLMVVLVGLGIIQMFEAYPRGYMLLKILSLAYMLYLAWKIATSSPPSKAGETGIPITFLQAALFQWVNPKAWAMALTAIGAYAPSHTLGSIITVAIIFGIINLPAVSSWTFLGLQMQRLLTNPIRLRNFNIAMALLLLLSAYPVIFS
ncbi:MAG: LysE family translocator [Geminicoccales bacterium]